MAKNNKNQEADQVVKNEEIKYSKEQLISSKKYATNKDLLQVLLVDNEIYTFKEVDQKIEEFKKRKV